MWRRLGLLAAVWAGLGVTAHAQVAGKPLVCTGSAATAPIRIGGVAERAGDFILTCTGGTPTAAGQTVLPVGFNLTFSSTPTSRLLAPGWSEALLVVDEPATSSQLSCSTSDGRCTIAGTGNGVGTYNGSPGRPNVFQASVSGNTLQWQVPLDPPGAGGTRLLRFTNLRVPTGLLVGVGIQTVVTTTSGQLPVGLANATQLVAEVRPSVTPTVTSVTSLNGQLSSFSVQLAEGFVNAFKALSSAGPILAPQSAPGGVTLDYETGFYNPALDGSIRGALGTAGVAHSGTRLRIRLNAVPGQVTVTAPLTINIGVTGVARLVTTDSSGAGNYTPATSGVLPNVSGVVSAVYEIVQSSGQALEILTVPFALTYGVGAPLFPSIDADVSLAPTSVNTTADTSSPIPRYTINQIQPIRISEPLVITTTALGPGVVGTGYAQPVQATGGASPYSFSITSGSPPPGLTLSTTGVLSGAPSAVGTYRFTVTARDAAQVTTTATYSVLIAAAGPLQTSASSVDFSAPQGGNPPPSRTVLVTASTKGEGFTIAVDAGSPGTATPSWIRVTPPSGITPAVLTIAVNQGDLPAGTYNARIHVVVAGNPNLSVDIPVTLSVKATAPKLDALPAVLKFDSRLDGRLGAASRKSGFILLRNIGGGGAISYATSILQGSKWLVGVTPSSGQAGPKNPGSLRVDVDSTGLTQGVYRDVLRVTSNAGNVDIPVILRVAPNGPLLDVNRTGVRFSISQSVASPQTREIKVLNRDASTTLQWSADVIRGGEYLALSTTSGAATQATPGSFRIGLKPAAASVQPGIYTGIVRVSAPGAAYSPRYVVVVVNVRAQLQPSDLDLDPGGIVLTGIARSTTPLSRSVALNASSGSPLPYQAAASTADGATWLSVTPASGNVVSSQTETLTVTADPLNLSAGVYTGEVTVATSTDSETLSVTLILTDAAAEQIPSNARAAVCSPNKLIIGSTGLTNNFSVPAGWPASLSVDVRDNCGALVNNATVVARFTNGDPPLPMQQENGTATYSTTWQPGTALAQANVTIDALTGDLGTSSMTLVGGVTANAVPKLYRNGTIHNLDPKLGGLLSPGLVVQIYGEALAGVAESTGSVPLSTNYKGTSVLIGPYEAPLYYVSPGQLVAQLPSELAPNLSYPIVVVANNQVTLPDEVDVVAVQPGVAAFSDATLIAQHSDYSLVTPQNPAKRNEFLIMYLVGLGATNPAVTSGAPSPGVAPLGLPLVTPTVSVGGTQAEVGFAGLTPFGVGLYQINFRVPASAPLNTPLQITVRQGDYTANVTTLTVAQ